VIASRGAAVKRALDILFRKSSPGSPSVCQLTLAISLGATNQLILRET
jgi:hypothetical protein